MRRPAATNSPVEEAQGEPRLPRNTSRMPLTKTGPGGKMGSALDSFAGDTQVNVKKPEQLKHVTTSIGKEHLFGKPQGDKGYKMHLNPHDVGRSGDMNGDGMGPKIKVPGIKGAKVPKI